MKKIITIRIVSDEQYDMGVYVNADKAELTPINREENKPYLETRVKVEGVMKEYNPHYGDGKICQCGHTYYRHFDSYENMLPVGCKYCGCMEFRPKEN